MGPRRPRAPRARTEPSTAEGPSARPSDERKRRGLDPVPDAVACTRLTVTEAARGFSDVVHRAYYRGESFLLTKGGREVARLVPVEARGGIPASELRRRLRGMPRLPAAEAEALSRALAEGRRFAGRVGGDPWESS